MVQLKRPQECDCGTCTGGESGEGKFGGWFCSCPCHISTAIDKTTKDPSAIIDLLNKDFGASDIAETLEEKFVMECSSPIIELDVIDDVGNPGRNKPYGMHLICFKKILDMNDSTVVLQDEVWKLYGKLMDVVEESSKVVASPEFMLKKEDHMLYLSFSANILSNDIL